MSKSTANAAITKLIKDRKARLVESQENSPTKVVPAYDDLGAPVTKLTDGKTDYAKSIKAGQAGLPPSFPSNASPTTATDDPEAKFVPNKVRGKASNSQMSEDKNDDKDAPEYKMNEDDEDEDDKKKEVTEDFPFDKKDDDDEEDDDNKKKDKKKVDESFKKKKKLKEADDDDTDDDKKKDKDLDESDDDMDDDDKKKVAEEDEKAEKDDKKDMDEAVIALFRGEKLTEAFKTKITTVFEAAVAKRVHARVKLTESRFQRKLNKRVQSIRESIAKKADGYLNYVVEKWLAENAVAIETGIRADISENFIAGLKTLFIENYIEVPESKIDVVESQAARITKLEGQLNEALNRGVKLTEEVNKNSRAVLIAESASGLTDTQKAKLTTLSEGVSFKSPDQFKSALETLKEGFLGTPATAKKTPGMLTEDLTSDQSIDNPDLPKGPMTQYVAALDRINSGPRPEAFNPRIKSKK